MPCKGCEKGNGDSFNYNYNLPTFHDFQNVNAHQKNVMNNASAPRTISVIVTLAKMERLTEYHQSPAAAVAAKKRNVEIRLS